MSRPVSNKLRKAVYASACDEAFIILLTINEDSLSAPIRVCSDNAEVVSQGETYLNFPFSVALPDDQDDAITSSRLIIDNTDQRIMAAIRSITSPPTIDMSVVLSSDPDEIEIGPISFTLRKVDYSLETIEGDIKGPDVLNESFPSQSFTPSLYPSLFNI